MNMYQKILVRAPNWIGDAVMAIPTLSALRARFPESRITLLAKPPVAALFEHHPAIDRLLVYESPGRHAGFAGLWRLVRSIREGRFDLAFLLQNAFEAALITAAAGIPERVGYAADGRRFLLTKSLDKKSAPFHQREAYLHLMSSVGSASEFERRPFLVISEKEKQSASDLLLAEGIARWEQVIGINPGAAYGASKRWDPARFAAAADRLAERHSAGVVIFGGPAEIAISEEVRRNMKHPAVVMAGKTTVRMMMALLSRCRLFITNDSGPMHIASALGVSVVAVFGPTNPDATSPAGADDLVVRNKVDCAPCTHRECPIDHRCMTGVSVDAVVEAAERQMARLGRRKIAVFLDRDGTINHDVGHMDALHKYSMIPEAAEAIARLNRRGISVIIVTNQSGVARGIFDEEMIGQVHHHLKTVLAEAGAHLDGIYYCPHHPEIIPCTCRKPQMGMIERAISEHPIDLSGSYVVGDKPLDMGLARGGMKGVLVRTGHGEASLQEMVQAGTRPDHVAADLHAAVEWILEDLQRRGWIAE
ncbi:MAG: lipopolysaccharide heptosyltransferase II [Candidatus Manganitrophus sp. SA1]|nr:lipopolysaccharide heptosyltransferase II [Candidatus Manganitrophus morganii]